MQNFYELDGFELKAERKSILAHVDCYEDSPVYEMMCEEYEDIIDEMMDLARPVGIIGFGTLPKSAATDDYKEGTPIIYGLCSIGGAISEQSTQAFADGEYVRGMLCDSIATNLLFSMEGRLLECLEEICREHHVGILRRLEAPHDLPMTIQREAWKHLELERRFGIRISSGKMFDPVKTSLNVYILTEDTGTFKAQHDCRRCSNFSCKFRNLPPSRIIVKNGSTTKEFEVGHGETLMAAMIREGCYVDAICGGNGRCGKCKVQVLAGNVAASSQDKAFFTEEELAAGWRLSCTLYPMDDLTVEYASEKDTAFDVLTEFRGGKTADRIGEKSGGEAAGDGQIKGAAKGAASAGDAESAYNIAIDIGTTTIAFALMAEKSSEILHAVTWLNSQRKYGADVISRIQKSVGGGKQELQECIRKDLSQGIAQLLSEYGILAKDVRQIAISGNTTMVHLLMGYDCDSLGVFPFTPVNVDFIHMSGEELLAGQSGWMEEGKGDGKSWAGSAAGLEALADAEVTLLPGISAFVGGDITAGMSACGFMDSDDICLLVDLGTNGEMALGNKEKILVTSTAAGPAFEGGNIEWGTGSVSGAICSVKIRDDVPVESADSEGDPDATGLRTEIRTIQDASPVGICGTGVVESVSELVRTELVDETGLLDDDYFDDGFPLADTADGRQIVFTQKDVREIQLAKSAVRAGIETLLIRYGIDKSQVARVYIAGGFGYRLDLEKAIYIGMLPEEFSDRIEAVGNSSLAGTIRYLQNADAKTELEKLAEISEEINLSADKDFNDFYMEHMMFEV